MEVLQGTIEYVTFHSLSTGFCVLRAHIKDKQELITVVGFAAHASVGEYIECQGNWVNDERHGLQFKTEQIVVIPPTTIDGIEKYLASGVIRGIGPELAKKLVESFGDRVFHVIQFESEQLMHIEGIGEKRKSDMITAFSEQQGVRNIMVFLQTHQVKTARALRIYKTYGDDAIAKVQENPYRLVQDVQGIGFKTADDLGMRLGVALDSTLRASAGVRYVLQTLCDNGHCAIPQAELVTASQKLLGVDTLVVEAAIVHELATQELVQDIIAEKICIYPKALYQAEVEVAHHLHRLGQGLPPWGDIHTGHALPIVEQQAGLTFSLSQIEAIQMVMRSKLSVITGGPGVGKTTLIHGIILLIHFKKLTISLCAPTGRAAKRLSEMTQLQASTIHRLLQFDPQSNGFKYNQNNKMPIDVLVIDESSMLDVVLFQHLLAALPDYVAIIFVGDIDQLPSVGPGRVLADLIQSGVITTVRLTEIFRQAESSSIIKNAYRVNQGELPLPNEGERSDFFTVYADTPEEIHRKLLQIVCWRLPAFYQCDPIRDIQILTPMNRGGLGTHGLNVALQQILNGQAESKLMRMGTPFAVGDKIIQLVNNYDKEVFNGDIGVIDSINHEEKKLLIRFEETLKAYDVSELDEISLAYAISIHKSQGSEFPIVVIPCSTQHYMLLARNVLYTGITRGKKLVVLIGQKKAIQMAVDNCKQTHRYTKLATRLKDLFL